MFRTGWIPSLRPQAPYDSTSARATVAMILDLYSDVHAIGFECVDDLALDIAPEALVSRLAQLREPTFISVGRESDRIVVKAHKITAESETSLHAMQLKLLRDPRTMFGHLRSKLLDNSGATVRVGSPGFFVKLTASEFAEWVRNFAFRGSYSTYLEEHAQVTEVSDVIAELSFELHESAGTALLERATDFTQPTESWAPLRQLTDEVALHLNDLGVHKSEDEEGLNRAIMEEMVRCVGDGSNPNGLGNWKPPHIESPEELLAALRLLPSDVGFEAFTEWIARLRAI